MMQGEVGLTVSTPQGSPDQLHYLEIINELLIEYEDLFMEPKSLAPTRLFDHSIHLKPNMEPVNSRSYRYPPIQKK